MHEDLLSLKLALKSSGVIIAIAFILMVFAYFLSITRNWRVVNNYTRETQRVIEDDPQGFSNFFTSTMDQCAQLFAQTSAQQPNVNSVHCEIAVQQLSELGINRLKDHSAIVYLRYRPGQLVVIDASGNVETVRRLEDFGYQFLAYRGSDKNLELERYLSGEASINRWDDFIYAIPQKEVIVPVEVNNEVVGYIFRGVIEK